MFQAKKLITISEQAIVDYSREKNFAKIYELNFHNAGLIAISNINKCSKLKVLDLSSNSISKIENLQNNTDLKELALYQNMITEIQNLEKLVELESLSLSFNQLQLIGGLKALKKLKSIQLGNNLIKTIEGFDSCKGLTSLDLSGNQIEKIQGLESLITLNELDLSWNKIQKMEGLQPVKASLTELYLQFNRLESLDGFIACDQLKILHLDGNALTSIAGLPRLATLEELSLSDNSISFLVDLAAGSSLSLKVMHIIDKTPKLEILDISANKFDNLEAICNQIFALSTLEDLSLEKNPFKASTDPVSVVMAKLTQVQRLNGKALPKDGVALEIIPASATEQQDDPFFRKPVLLYEMDETVDRIMRDHSLRPFGERTTSSLDYISLDASSRPSTSSARPQSSASSSSRPSSASSRPSSASGRKPPVMKPMTAHMNTMLKLKPVDQYDSIKTVIEETRSKVVSTIEDSMIDHSIEIKEAWGDKPTKKHTNPTDDLLASFHGDLLSMMKESIGENSHDGGDSNPYRAKILTLRQKQARKSLPPQSSLAEKPAVTVPAKPESTSRIPKPSLIPRSNRAENTPASTSSTKKPTRRLADAMDFSKRYPNEKDALMNKDNKATAPTRKKKEILKPSESPIAQGATQEMKKEPKVDVAQDDDNDYEEKADDSSVAGSDVIFMDMNTTNSWSGRTAERKAPPTPDRLRRAYTHFRPPSESSIPATESLVSSLNPNLMNSLDGSYQELSETHAAQSAQDSRPSTPGSARSWWNATATNVARPVTPTQPMGNALNASNPVVAASTALKVDQSRLQKSQATVPDSRPKSPLLNAKKLPTAKGGLAPRKTAGK